MVLVARFSLIPDQNEREWHFHRNSRSAALLLLFAKKEAYRLQDLDPKLEIWILVLTYAQRQRRALKRVKMVKARIDVFVRAKVTSMQKHHKQWCAWRFTSVMQWRAWRVTYAQWRAWRVTYAQWRAWRVTCDAAGEENGLYSNARVKMKIKQHTMTCLMLSCNAKEESWLK
jgi:hypothetical protein